MDHCWHNVIHSYKFTDYTPEDLLHSVSASIFPTILCCSFPITASRQFMAHLKISFPTPPSLLALSYELSNVLSASGFREGYSQPLLLCYPLSPHLIRPSTATFDYGLDSLRSTPENFSNRFSSTHLSFQPSFQLTTNFLLP